MSLLLPYVRSTTSNTQHETIVTVTTYNVALHTKYFVYTFKSLWRILPTFNLSVDFLTELLFALAIARSMFIMMSSAVIISVIMSSSSSVLSKISHGRNA